MNIPHQAQRAIHQQRLYRLTFTAFYQTFISRLAPQICPHCGSERRRLKIHFCNVQIPNIGSRAETTAASFWWILGHHGMCFKTKRTCWNSSSLFVICIMHDFLHRDCLTDTSQQKRQQSLAVYWLLESWREKSDIDFILRPLEFYRNLIILELLLWLRTSIIIVYDYHIRLLLAIF